MGNGLELLLRPSERLTPVSIMGDLLKVPINPLGSLFL